jgi:predicted nucleotidyltransferase component of viral defense system
MKDLIQNRLKTYVTQSADEEEIALKEITQEVVLLGLSQVGFFERAVFQGGTSLRILHRVTRFSEDLDFSLLEPDLEFDIQPVLEAVRERVSSYGYSLEVFGKERGNVHQRFLKDDSIRKQLDLQYKIHANKKISIKVEVDVNPPKGAVTQPAFLDFPQDFSIRVHDLPTLFAWKCHALLCRDYAKGRDWYDFGWYISNKISPNYPYLNAALDQQGPWKGLGIQADGTWLKEALHTRIDAVVWDEAVRDMDRFLLSDQKAPLKLWGPDLFHHKANQLS